MQDPETDVLEVNVLNVAAQDQTNHLHKQYIALIKEDNASIPCTTLGGEHNKDPLV